jgi:glycosidase
MHARRILSVALVLGFLGAPAVHAAVEIAPLEGGRRFHVTFRHTPVIAVHEVQLAGSWNNWSKPYLLMKETATGAWEASLELKPGHYAYKFVLDERTWKQDLENSKSEPDGQSGFNSVLELGEGRAPAEPGKEGDGAVSAQDLSHDPGSLAQACVVDGKRRLVLRMRTLAHDVESVSVDATPRPEASSFGKADDQGLVSLRKIATVDAQDVWEARLLFARGTTDVRYQFVARDGETRVALGKKGTATKARAAEAGRFSVNLAQLARFETPDWARDATFYQIFPDRFRNGDTANDPKLPRRPEGRSWHVDDAYLEDWGGEPSHRNFFGGDLKGIREKLDYLGELGVNALYLNPIFAARSNHKYDCADYEKVDPSFGTEEDFQRLIAACNERGMRVILDAVFNHTGDGHYAFQDCMKNGPKSPFWSWYIVNGSSVLQSPKPNYQCWWGYGSLPQLNTRNPQVVSHLLKVGEKWLKDGASGWRLDVPNEVEAMNPEFWPEFRRRVRKTKPDAYIVGEIWTDAESYLRGDRFDAVMNYPFRSAALEFLGKGSIPAAKFDELLAQQRATYPEPALRVQFNLLGSHDTERVLTVTGDARRVRLCQTFQFAYLGPPVVYYGDEVGLAGSKDPECRRCFPWDESRQDAETRELVRKLAHIRSQEIALRRGTVRTVALAEGAIAFLREPEAGDAGRPVVCILNTRESEIELEVPVPGVRALDLLGSGSATPVAIEHGTVRVTVPPVSGRLFALEGASE